jgi:hypothetical protein
MTTLLILGSVIGTALVICVIAYWSRKRKHTEAIQLDVGRKLRR